MVRKPLSLSDTRQDKRMCGGGAFKKHNLLGASVPCGARKFALNATPGRSKTQKDRKTERQKDRKTERQTDRQTDRQKERKKERKKKERKNKKRRKTDIWQEGKTITHKYAKTHEERNKQRDTGMDGKGEKSKQEELCIFLKVSKLPFARFAGSTGGTYAR